ncbi:MAG: DUF2336 domain-containing protein [Sphingomonadales bacterium]
MVDAKFEKLIELARDKSRASRARLVENITDLFLSDAGRLNEHERALMSDILTKLIASIEKKLKAELAEALAKSDAELPEVAKLLAGDEIEIAEPLLSKSQLLKDDDLIEIIRMRTDEHRMAIAIREGVSEEVSDVLIDLGSQDVIEALLKNPDGVISRRAMKYLVAESRRVDRFQEPLLNREDLSPELAYRMYWWVTAALRKRIMTEFKVDPVVLDQALQRATQQALVSQEEGQGAFVRAQKLVRRMAESGELTHKFLLQALRQERIAVYVAGIGELANLDFRTAWQITSDRKCESIAVLAKAIEVDRTDFTSMFLLLAKVRDGEEVQSPNVLKKLLEMYDAIDRDSARGALMYWQQNRTYQVAVEELDSVS